MLVEKLYEGEARPRTPFSAGVIRMSMSEACTRRIAMEYLGYEVSVDPASDVYAARMQDGLLHEQDIVRRLLMKGVKIWNFGERQTWVTLKLHNLFWRGHPDLFCELEGKIYGLECKAFRGEVFERYVSSAEEVLPGRFVIRDLSVLMSGPFPLMGQVQLYLNTDKSQKLGIEGWLVLIKNKNTAELAECLVPRIPDYLEKVASRWRGFWALVSVGRLPPRGFSKSSANCRLCPFFEPCWGVLSRVSPGVKELDEPALMEKVRLWREAAQLESMASVRKELARIAFGEAAIAHDSRTLKLGGLEVRVNNRSRTGLDSGYTSELLTELLARGVISSEQYDSCWSETEYTEVRVVDREPEKCKITISWEE